jgi:uncharacterized protein
LNTNCMNDLPELISKKLIVLSDLLKSRKRVAIAFSGGVDSTLLLRLAYDNLGKNALGIYCDSPLQPAREKISAVQLAKEIGVELFVITINEIEHDAFRHNPPERCYLCKGLIFDKIVKVAHARGFDVVVDGSNHDDLKDYRPGARALKERGIISPLLEAGLTKEEIRTISKAYGLSTWDKDALACLATRFPFGEKISRKKLEMIDKAEEFLAEKGFRNVRARCFGSMVRIEVRSDQVEDLLLPPLFNEVYQTMLDIGFKKCDIDKQGYRQGHMNKL